MSMLRQHYLALILACVVGAFAVAPSVLAPLALDPAYHGIQAQFLDDEDTYRVQITDLMRGQSVTSPYLASYATSSAPVPSLNLWYYAAPALLFGLPIVVLASKFLFPALLFLLVYGCTLLLVPRLEKQDARLLAITAGLLVTLGYDFVDVHHMAAVLRGRILPGPLVWTRLVNPIIGALEVFGTAVLLVLAGERRSRYAAPALGFLLALTIGYFFSYVIALAMTGLLCLLLAVRREWRTAGGLAAAIVISFVLDSAYWFQELHAVGGSTGRALALHNGMFYTHAPVLNLFLLAATVLVGAAYAFRSRQDNSRAWIYLAAFLGAGWLAFNQQIITGREIWYPHFVQYVIPLSYLSALVALTLALRPRFPKVWRAALFALAGIALVYGLYSTTSYRAHLDSFRALQDDAPVFSYLNKNGPSECVTYVLDADSTLARLMPAYTSCRLYSTSFIFYGVPADRVLHNYLLYLRLSGISAADVHDYLLTHPDEIRLFFYDDWHQLFGKGTDAWLTERSAQVEHAYIPFAHGDLKQELQTYHMDYLVTEKPLDQKVIAQLPGLSLATSTGRFFLYSF